MKPSVAARAARRRRALWRSATAVAVAVALGCVAALAVNHAVLAGFRLRAADSAFPRGHLDESIMVVTIDSRALAETGRSWPWPRDLQAELLERIATGAPRAVSVDVVFAPDDTPSPRLAAALRAAPSVIASSVQTEGEQRGLPVVATSTTPAPDLTTASAAVGHGAVSADKGDGIVRTVALSVLDGGQIVPSLSLATLAVVEGVDARPILRSDGVQIGQRSIPTDRLHQLRVSWPEELDEPSPDHFVSAADVLAGRVDADRFRDRVVFVGVTDESVGDRHRTPIATQAGDPGVFIHVAAYNTMLTKSYLSSVSALEAGVTTALFALAVALAVLFLPIVIAAGVVLTSAAALVVESSLRFDAGTLADPILSGVAMALAVPVAGGARYLLETRQRRRVSRLFANYVPEAVANELIDTGLVDAVVQGRRVDVTVLFCDLRGFTARSASMTPSDVREFLDLYYEYACAIVLDHGGTVMQFVGDEVFAVFGAPIDDDAHATKAVACSAELQQDVERLDEMLAQHGHEPLRFGIGLNSGPVIAAHVGTTTRRQYSVIGDTVNLGSRLCGQAGPGRVVLADATLARTDPRPPVQNMGPLALKGVADGFVAWRLVFDRDPPGSADR